MTTISPTRARQLAYGWFDFANSSVTLIFHAYLFPLYVKQVLFQGHPEGDTVWGATFAVSVLVAAVLAPFIGKAVDGRKRFRVFVWFAGASFITMLLLGSSIGQGTWVVLGVFVLANVCFYFASNLYDSLLTVVAEPNERASTSSFAWGFGYLGGIVAFAGVFAIQKMTGMSSPLPYLFTGLFYAIFGMFAIRRLKPFVKEEARIERLTFKQMLAVLNRNRLRRLVGYWLIADCVNAVIVFIGIYAATQLGMTATMIGVILMAVQLLAFPGTLLMNTVASKVGVLNTIRICGIIWGFIILILVFGRSQWAIAAVVVLTGLVIGSTQALMRAHYSMIVSETRTSEMFGWYALATESAAFLAPLLFGVIAGVFGNQPLAMAFLGVPLLFGVLLVNEDE